MQEDKKIRWGILSTGNIARQFASDLAELPDAELAAVASRSELEAATFARKYGFKRSYGSYESLAYDNQVDVVYVATPHPFHYENTMMLLEAGKAVLCEKPVAMNAEQICAMVAKAREKQVFLMEAMWMRFFPIIKELLHQIQKGSIGHVRSLEASFGFPAHYDPESRLFSPALGGGALLDLGIYPISFAHMILGNPVSIQSTACLGPTGVDHQSAYLLKFANGELATLSASLESDMTEFASVCGTEGRIRIPRDFFHPTRLVVERADGTSEAFVKPYESHGYQYEAQAVMDYLKQGALEAEEMPLDESIAIMRTLDAVRACWET